MAKKKKNSGSVTTAKVVKKGAVAAWICATVFVLVASGVVGAFGYGTQGFKDWGFSRFVPKGKVEVEQPVQIEEQTGGGMVLSDSVSDCGAVLASYSIERSEFAAYSLGDNIESSYVLYAKVLPEEATFDTVEYSVDWVNGDSEWAQGKVATDYVKVTPGTYGVKNAATVSCRRAFGEPITITAAYSFDETIKATVQADYIGYILYESNHGRGWYDDDDSCPSTINSGVSFKYLGHTGTIAPNLEDCISYCYVPGFISWEVRDQPFKVWDESTKTAYQYEGTYAEKELGKLGISTTWDYEDMDTGDQYVRALYYTGKISFTDCEIGDVVCTPSYLEMMYETVHCPDYQRAKMKSIISKYYVPDTSRIDDTELYGGYFLCADRKVYGSHIFYSADYLEVLAGEMGTSYEDCFFGTTSGLIIYGNDVQFEEPGEMIFG